MMRKLFLLTAIAILSVSLAKAQSPVKYRGEVDLGYSFGTGVFANNRVNIHTVQGFKVGEYFSTGVGIGVDYYHEGGEGDVIVPLYLNLKGYIPISGKVVPYFSLDVGMGIGASNGLNGLSGVLLTPAFGVNAGKVKIQLGYNLQQLSDSGVSLNFNALQIKVGYVF